MRFTGHAPTDALLTGTLVVLIVGVGLFLVLRAFWLWYWNLSAIEHRLTEIRDELRRMPGTLSPVAPAGTAPPGEYAAPPWPSAGTAPAPRIVAPSPQAGSRNHD